MDETWEEKKREREEREAHAQRLRKLLREQMRQIPIKVLDSGSADLARRFKQWAFEARRASESTAVTDKATETLQSLISKYIAFERGDA
jgi:hypothetical protein